MAINHIDPNTTLLDVVFKDASPIRTVEKIKGILSEHGIHTTEVWNESGVSFCHSLRVSVDGTAFGTNGKGLTKEFALASGYGELVERMQLGLFSDSSVQKIGLYDEVIGQDEMIPVDQLYRELPSWYDFLADGVNKLDDSNIDGMTLLSRYANADGLVPTAPFYHLMHGQKIHIPRKLRASVCGSNGGAAGNSMEEAIVQALSELIERRHKLRVINECICPPDIPDEVLQGFPTAYSIISELRAQGFRITVKDCSMGTQFPVVCVCYIHPQTGRYHTHFGAYPLLEIAVERALTESFQGRNISGFASNENFIYNTEDLTSYRSIYKDLKRGNYDKTPAFFIGESPYPYNPHVGFDGKNNKELLSQLVTFFGEQGHDILVYNSSCLGFPTYSVLIPAYSEVLLHSLSQKHNSFANAPRAQKALRDPSKATMNDHLLTLLHINEMKKMADMDPALFRFATCANLPLRGKNDLDNRLMLASMAYIYYAIHQPKQAMSFLNKLISSAPEDEAAYLICLKRYLSMQASGYDEDRTRALLTMFHDPDTVNEVYEQIERGENPFDRFILHCDGEHCEGCRIHGHCGRKYTLSLINIIRKKAKALDFDAFVESLKPYVWKK